MGRFKVFGISTMAVWDLYYFIANTDTIAYFV